MELVVVALVIIFAIERITTYLLLRRFLQLFEIILDKDDWLPLNDDEENENDEPAKEIRGFAGGE